MPLSREEASLFFRLLVRRYERASLIVTSNKSFADWGDVFNDEVLATAILDRLLHHATTANIQGESYRPGSEARMRTRAAWRSLVVQFGASPGAAAETDPAADGPRLAADCRHTRDFTLAELMRRSLGLDVLACPRCGGRLTLIALIEDPAVIARVLRHLRLPTDIPEAQAARAPPLHLVVDAPPTDEPA